MIALLVVFVAYLGSAKFGLLFAPKDTASATLVWAPAGLAVAAVVRLGPRALAIVWFAAFAANLLNAHTALLASAVIACGNTLAAFIAAAIILRFGWKQALIPAALAGAMIASSVGIDSLAAFNGLRPDQALQARRTWLLGDLLGILVVTPAVLMMRFAR